MGRLWLPPLLVVPLIIYNLVAFDIVGDRGLGWAAPVISINMSSGAIWTISISDAIVIGALALLFVEILKATRIGAVSILDHSLSILVFIAYLVEFLLVPAAATSLFFTCMLMALVDTVSGFSVTIRGAGRDVSFY